MPTEFHAFNASIKGDTEGGPNRPLPPPRRYDSSKRVGGNRVKGAIPAEKNVDNSMGSITTGFNFTHGG